MDEATRKAKTEASRATAWAIAGAIAERVVRFAIFVLIARLVTPDEFGVVALAMILVDLLQGLLDAGLSQALVRLDRIGEDQRDTAFWASAASGVAMTLIVLAVDGGSYLLLGNRPFQPVLLVLSIVPLIQSLGLIHHALIVRALGFKALAGRNIAASLLSGAAGIALAWLGWGVWALVARSILLTIATSAIAWWVMKWRPRARFRRDAITPLLPDSARLMQANIVSQVNTRGFDLMAGLVIGAAALATLRIAGQVTMLLMELTAGPFAAVAFATLARHKDDPSLTAHTFQHLSRAAALLMYPAFFGLAAVSHDLFPLLFGDRWSASAALMPILAAIVLPAHFQVMLRAALFASGRTDRLVQWEMLQAVSTIVAGIAGAPFGLIGIAAAATVHLYVMIPLGAIWLRRDAGIDPVLLVRGTFPALLASAAMAAVVVGARAMLPPGIAAIPLLASLIGIGILTYAACLPLLAGDMLKQAFASLRKRRGRSMIDIEPTRLSEPAP